MTLSIQSSIFYDKDANIPAGSLQPHTEAQGAAPASHSWSPTQPSALAKAPHEQLSVLPPSCRGSVLRFDCLPMWVDQSPSANQERRRAIDQRPVKGANCPCAGPVYGPSGLVTLSRVMSLEELAMH